MHNKCMGFKMEILPNEKLPTDETRLCTVERRVRKQKSTSRFVHATLSVYSTSFVRSSIFNEKNYLTTKLQTSKNFLVHVPDKYAKQALTAIYTISPAKAF